MKDTSDPSQIGRYRIIKPLGQGAMATVYLAELATLGGFRRKVALKVVRDEFARDAKFGQLMAREAMIGSLLQHPAIVETLEFNEADGRMFLALEFVEGQTVEELIKQAKADGRPSLSMVHSLEIIVQVLQGLSYAHTLETDEGEGVGIVHRDLKPGNIMVSRHGQVKVMDFGIAKAKVAMATLTAAGQVRGTPIYMAPEQVTGQALDGRADQFAAATVLYEMLTGKQVFIARNLIEIMRAVARAEVSEALATVTELQPKLGEPLGRMWSRAAADRYPTCAEAAAELQDVLFQERHKSLTATPVPPPPEDGTQRPRHRRRKKRRREPEKHGPIHGLVTALGFGRKKPKEPDPPRKKRRRKRRATEPGGPARRARRHAADHPDSGEEPLVFVDDTTFGDQTDEGARRRAEPAPPSEPPPESVEPSKPPQESVEPSKPPPPPAAGPARLGPRSTPPTPPPKAISARTRTPAPPRGEAPPTPRTPPPQAISAKTGAPPPPSREAPSTPRTPPPQAISAKTSAPPAPEPPKAPRTGDTTAPPTLSPSPPTEPAAPRPTWADPFDVPTAAGLKARPDLVSSTRERPAAKPVAGPTPSRPPAPDPLLADPGRVDPRSDVARGDLPHLPHLRPRLAGGARTAPMSDAGGPPGPRRLDPGDVPTVQGLGPLSTEARSAEPDDAFDLPNADNLAAEDQPTPGPLAVSDALSAFAARPLAGPTRPMQAVDVRAALAQADPSSMKTERMAPSSALLMNENDLRTRPMPVRPGLGGNIASLGAAPRPTPKEAEITEDEPGPTREGSDSALDPFFFED